VRVIAALCLLSVAGCGRRTGHHEVVLWAWQRAEDLSRLPPDVGVAFLAQTLFVEDGQVSRQPRTAPLHVAPSKELTAVTRIETRGLRTDAERAPLVDAVVATAELPGVTTVQLDYDARASERPFYRALLSEVRGRLPRTTRLSITALASWCLVDRWLSGLPVDEAVPMLFRLGVNTTDVEQALTRGDFSEPLCRKSVGVSTDERQHWRIAPGRRVYVFSPRAWTDRSARLVLGEVSE
jgi:hypothetical protein